MPNPLYRAEQFMASGRTLGRRSARRSSSTRCYVSSTPNSPTQERQRRFIRDLARSCEHGADLDHPDPWIARNLDRLIEVIRGLSSDERDPVRERLLELFIVVGTSDPRVATARRALASALF